jgi:hypothetical protein
MTWPEAAFGIIVVICVAAVVWKFFHEVGKGY